MLKFDTAYYKRFYGANGAHDAKKIAHLATAVHHLAAWWGINITSVLDVGAGMGMWRDWYHMSFPEVTVRSIDVSEHACKTWGHEQRDIAAWRPRGKSDLVVCHSVLQYLDNQSVIQAFNNLAAATRHVMYLELPTKWDYENIIDESGLICRFITVQHSGTANTSPAFPPGRCRVMGAAQWNPNV
jgi:hypothetical protein